MPWLRVVDSPYPQSAQQGNPFAKGLGFALFAVGLAGILALASTVEIIQYPSFPDDDTLSVGVFGFTFIVFLDLIVICRGWWAGFRNHRLDEALVMTVLLVPAGLLVASVVGVLPWSSRWLLLHYPWIRTLLRLFFWGWFVFWVVLNGRARRKRESLDRPS
jgi:hypothetical protein